MHVMLELCCGVGRACLSGGYTAARFSRHQTYCGSPAACCAAAWVVTFYLRSFPHRWMLLGDDDTLFSLPAVMAMLGKMKLSHTKPIAISDFLVGSYLRGGEEVVQYKALAGGGVDAGHREGPGRRGRD